MLFYIFVGSGNFLLTICRWLLTFGSKCSLCHRSDNRFIMIKQCGPCRRCRQRTVAQAPGGRRYGAPARRAQLCRCCAAEPAPRGAPLCRHCAAAPPHPPTPLPASGAQGPAGGGGGGRGPGRPQNGVSVFVWSDRGQNSRLCRFLYPGCDRGVKNIYSLHP